MVTVAKESHLDGVVLSPQDLPLLSSIRKNFSRDRSFLFVTPGIRLPGTSTHDQNRFSTPFFAWKEGADLLVLGRTLLENDPDSAKKALLDEWERFLKEKL
jgi:orotidine-5'-phosphate decarboxylase